MVISDLSWRRVNSHLIPDWNAYRAARLNIAAADIKFTPSAASPLSEKLNLNELNFNAINNTAYNYWEIGFTILLYGGGRVAGINHYLLTDFLSGETRQVRISWPGNLSRVDRVVIIPEINIMKNDIYIPYQGGVDQPSGATDF